MRNYLILHLHINFSKRTALLLLFYNSVTKESFIMRIRVITKLPNTEQSSKGKGKTYKSTNRQNQSTTEKLGITQTLKSKANTTSMNFYDF